MTNFLFNPFKIIAGGRSLLLGLVIMLLTALIAWASNVHFPDIISLKTSPDLPLTYLLTQTLANWLVFSTCLFIFALIASPSSIRAIDIFGTQALARFPYLPGALIGFSGTMDRFGQFILSKTIQPDIQSTISSLDILVAIVLIIFSLLMLIWMITLMYNAFSISANMKGAKAIVGFIVILILSVIVNQIISYQLFKLFS